MEKLKKMANLFLLTYICADIASSIEYPHYIKPESSIDIQVTSVQKLIQRCLRQHHTKFNIGIDKSLDFRSFSIKTIDEKVFINGSDGVSIAKGFHYYLKYYIKRDISWIQTEVVTFPSKLPKVNLTLKAENPIIYYQNVCTWSYSFVWWQFPIWRKHIDWMAMMGITLTIAPIQEYLWYQVYTNLGLSDEDIHDHFAGPGFLAWQRMGNIRRWGGPISYTYIVMQMYLQKKIIKAQRDLGITVALPSFAGHVPLGLYKLYPNATFTPIERWNGFEQKFCCDLFLDPNDELFTYIASMFLKTAIQTYGTNHIYFCDPFNELQPRLAETSYINMTSYYIYNSMKRVDPSAIWLLQGWMFVKSAFWTNTLVQTFLNAVPVGKVFILDLQSEQFPQYERTHSYFGQPFIWCMLHNFGGTLGMHGSVNIINTQIRMAKNFPNSTMIGVGITPEGIHQNYVIYSLVLERAWIKDDFNLSNWFKSYSNSRYGIEDLRLENTWAYLKNSVYSFHWKRKIRGKYTITRRPSLNIKPWIWYNSSILTIAWESLLSANSIIINSLYHNYEDDIVDINRQFLQVLADKVYINLVSAYNERNKNRFNFTAYMMLDILRDLELILSTNNNFLLGRWIKSARKIATTNVEGSLFEINARNQITSWGQNGQILDYATKQWSGIVQDYYQPRWTLFLQMLNNSLTYNITFNSKRFQYMVNKQIEMPFTFSNKKYLTHSIGCPIKTSSNLFNKWSHMIKSDQFKKYLYCEIRQIMF